MSTGEVLEISPYTNRRTIKERDRLEQDRFSSSCGCHGAREMGGGGGNGWLVTFFFHSVFKLDTRFSLHVICRCANGVHVSVGHPTRKLVVQYLGGGQKIVPLTLKQYVGSMASLNMNVVSKLQAPNKCPLCP